MSFAKAKIRRFYEINDENRLPGPGHYDPYKKSDYRAKPTLKTINSHAKKNEKKTRAKLASVLRERVNKSVTKQELLNLADESSQKVRELEIKSVTSGNDIDDFICLQSILNEKLAEMAIQMENSIDKVVEKAAVMELQYKDKLNLKNLEIEELKQQLSSLRSIINIKGAEKDDFIVHIERNEQDDVLEQHSHL